MVSLSKFRPFLLLEGRNWLAARRLHVSASAEDNAELLAIDDDEAPKRLVKSFNIETIDTNLYRSNALVRGLVGRDAVYGGQVIGQSLRAAQDTVDDDRAPHSMHCYFLKAGSVTKPIVYRVDRVREGGSFSTRIVKAIQEGEVLFTTQISFQKSEKGGMEHSRVMAKVPPPSELLSYRDLLKEALEEHEKKSTMTDHQAMLLEFKLANTPPTFHRVYEHRPVDQKMFDFTKKKGLNVQRSWIKTVVPYGDLPALQRQIAAYISDSSVIDAGLFPHLSRGFIPSMVFTLDHSLWFHRPDFTLDDWCLIEEETARTAERESSRKMAAFFYPRVRKGWYVRSADGKLRLLRKENERIAGLTKYDKWDPKIKYDVYCAGPDPEPYDEIRGRMYGIVLMMVVLLIFLKIAQCIQPYQYLAKTMQVTRAQLLSAEISGTLCTLFLFAAVMNDLNPCGEINMCVLLVHVCILTMDIPTAFYSGIQYLKSPSFYTTYRNQLLYQFGISFFNVTIHMATTLNIVWRAFAWKNPTKPTQFWSGMIFHLLLMKLLQSSYYGEKWTFSSFALAPGFYLVVLYTRKFRSWVNQTKKLPGSDKTPVLPVQLILTERLFSVSALALLFDYMKRPIIGHLWQNQASLLGVYSAVHSSYLMVAGPAERCMTFFFSFGTAAAMIAPVIFSFALDWLDAGLRMRREVSSLNPSFIDFVHDL